MQRLFIICYLIFVSQTASAFSYTLKISEESLQEKVEALMPLERKTYFITTVFSHPKVELSEKTNQIGVNLQMAISTPLGMKSTGHTKIVGTLDYNAQSHEFFFKNPQVIDLTIDNMPDTSSFRDLAQMIADKILATTPVYKLKGGDLKRDMAQTMLKSVKVEDKQLLVELELF